MNDAFNCMSEFKATSSGEMGKFFSLPLLEKNGLGNISRLPVSLRIILESALRNYDGKKITKEHIHHLANWEAKGKRVNEIPFVVARIVLQDYTGVPLLADLAAMRGTVKGMGINPEVIEPLVPVSLVIDHSVQTNYTRKHNALALNMELEFSRNQERYKFMKWGASAFNKLEVVPPGVGIVHQVNLEYLSKGVFADKNNVYYPDTVVGTDSHTTMVNGIGVVGWGVGGIEAEAGMLGQPIYFLTPDVVGFHLRGKLREGVTATDLVLTLTEILRKAKVVGKIVEYFGEGAKHLTAQDRATIANMAPDYGATMGFFPVDEMTIAYYEQTGRTKDEVEKIKNYFEAQKLFGIPQDGECDYTQVIELDLDKVLPSVSGPKRPQDRINLPELKETFEKLLRESVANNGYSLDEEKINAKAPVVGQETEVAHGDVLIAGITSCTNTSNPSVLVAAGILAKKACEKGLTVKPYIKTSLTPGSRVVTEYLKKAGLLDSLEKIGFDVAGYGCATCIGNVGDLDEAIEHTVTKNKMIVSAVLSGNRNFEARIHSNIRANFLMSPPLVVAFALAGTVRINMDKDPLGTDTEGNPVFLKDIWPTSKEIEDALLYAKDSKTYKELYGNLNKNNILWEKIPSTDLAIYQWDGDSTYVAEPPFFDGFSMHPEKVDNILNARALAILGDSITTDHISPAGSISPKSPAGEYLQHHGISPVDFNSFGARRGHHEVMMRGTFSNVRIKNRMVPDIEGGYTLCKYNNEVMSIYDAAMLYQKNNIPTIIFAGEEYGTGSSRDWAAKGTQLLGVKAVVAKSFERIHRSNLIGMGVLPCQFKEGESVESLKLTGSEIFDILGLEKLDVNKEVTLVIKSDEGQILRKIPLILRLDTEIEIDYFNQGGILPYVLRQIIGANTTAC